MDVNAGENGNSSCVGVGEEGLNDIWKSCGGLKKQEDKKFDGEFG